MKPTTPRRTAKSINRVPGYKQHYITFYTLFDGDGTLKFRIDSEPPTDLDLCETSEMHVVVSNLAASDFFDTNLFHNTNAVVRWTKHVGRPYTYDAA